MSNTTLSATDRAREHFGSRGSNLVARLRRLGFTGRTLAELAGAWADAPPAQQGAPSGRCYLAVQERLFRQNPRLRRVVRESIPDGWREVGARLTEDGPCVLDMVRVVWLTEDKMDVRGYVMAVRDANGWNWNLFLCGRINGLAEDQMTTGTVTGSVRDALAAGAMCAKRASTPNVVAHIHAPRSR